MSLKIPICDLLFATCRYRTNNIDIIDLRGYFISITFIRRKCYWFCKRLLIILDDIRQMLPYSALASCSTKMCNNDTERNKYNMTKKQPKWLDNAVFYQIYPQSFKDSNGDGIGDLPGIIEKLDYIRELGCNAIWINPCFDSPFNDAGYDIRDYKQVAPRYGTNEDLKRLFAEVHSRQMHIILDLVPGHTSVEHPWFKQSMKTKENAYTDRYIWTDHVFMNTDGMNTLRGISDRDGCAILNFFSSQPALNYGYYHIEHSWQQGMEDSGPLATLEALKDIMRFWLKMGCDGFRVDMAAWCVKNDDEERSGNIALWKKIRLFLDEEFPEAAMVSEWGNPDQSLRGGFYMDFQLMEQGTHYEELFRCEEPYFSSRGKGDFSEYAKRYYKSVEASGGKGLICIPSGNHDIDRLARRLCGKELKLAFCFLLSMPGAPFIYYGDEIGMHYVEGLVSKEGGYQRTGSRSPMQWNKELNAGFSSAAPERLYIPIDPDPYRPDVKSQLEEESSLYREVQRLIRLRLDNIALQSNAKVEFVETGYPLVLKRKCDEQEITVIINPTMESREVVVENGRLLYISGEASLQNGRCLVEGQSAAFIEH